MEIETHGVIIILACVVRFLEGMREESMTFRNYVYLLCCIKGYGKLQKYFPRIVHTYADRSMWLLVQGMDGSP